MISTELGAYFGPLLILFALNQGCLWAGYALARTSPARNWRWAGVCLLRAAGIASGLLLLVLAAGEISYYLGHGALYRSRSVSRKVALMGVKGEKVDTALVDKDGAADSLVLERDCLRAGAVERSPNASLEVVGEELVLRSLDGRPAFVRRPVPVNRLEALAGDPHPYFLSFSGWARSAEPGSEPFLAVSYRGLSARSPASASGATPVLLTTSPGYADGGVCFDAEQRRLHRDEAMTLEFGVQRGRAVLQEHLLIACRQRGGFPRKEALFGDGERFSSAQGFFPQRIGFRKRPGQKRFLFLGGSTMYGAQYGTLEATIPKWFDFKLQALAPGRFDVLNAGINSATTVSMVNGVSPVRRDRRRLAAISDPSRAPDYLFDIMDFNYLDLEPDAVVIAPMYNDLVMPVSGPGAGGKECTALRFFAGRAGKRLLANYALAFYCYRIIEGRCQRRTAGTIARGDDRAALDAYRSNLVLVVGRFRQAGSRVYLTALPNPALYRETPEAGGDKRMFALLKKLNPIDEGIIREAAEAGGARYLDIRSRFRLLPGGADREIYHRDCVHLTSFGNALSAEFLWEQILPDLIEAEEAESPGPERESGGRP